MFNLLHIRKFCLALLLSAIGLTAVVGGEAVSLGRFQVNPNGVIEFEHASLSMVFYGDHWKKSAGQAHNAVKPDAGYPRMEEGNWVLRGTFTVPGGAFATEQVIRPRGDDAIELAITLRSAQPVATDELAMLLFLPTNPWAGQPAVIDAKEIALPQKFDKTELFPRRPYSELQLRGKEKWTIRGGAKMLMQDDRKYNAQSFSARIAFTPDSGALTQASIKLELSCQSYQTRPLSIRNAANFGFADPVAGDGRGGWTDQGPDNDLHMIPAGAQDFGGVKFDIADDRATNGKSCIVLGGKHLAGQPLQVAVAGGKRQDRYLCLLHALGWAPEGHAQTGKVRVVYIDGTDRTFPVVSGENVGNWWYPTVLPRANVAWQTENQRAYVGLYLSAWPLDGRPIERIELINDGSAIWMIAAISTSSEPPPRQIQQPVFQIADADWKPVKVPRSVLPESALDFSFLADAPAGKHGFLTVRNGKFVFEKNPGQPARFYGTNLYFDLCFPDREHAEKLADLLARMGYNSIRFHHFDYNLTVPGDAQRLQPDPEKLDRMDYLFKCLKDRGIYITLDLYTVRGAPLPDGKFSGIQDGKTHIMLRKEARENLKAFTRNLLTHVNPYTGLAWKDDPALVFISLVNEDGLFWIQHQPDSSALVKQKFEEFCRMPEGQLRPGESQNLRKLRFVAGVQRDVYRDLSQFLRDLGVRTPFTDHNNSPQMAITRIRSDYDYVDQHGYWAHPSFVGPVRWKLPIMITRKSSLSLPQDIPAMLAPGRIYGKPFAVTEFNYCSPNPYRAEGGVIFGAFAAFQDWDALYRFGFAGKPAQLDREFATDIFDGIDDPMQSLSDRIATLLFLRGDVTAARQGIAFEVPDGEYLLNPAGEANPYPDACALLGWVTGVGSVTGGDPLPDGVRLSFAVNALSKPDRMAADLGKAGLMGQGVFDLSQGRFRSSTGQLELNRSEGRFRVVTPRTEAVILCDKGDWRGDFLRVANRGNFACVAASSLDSGPLADSGRILLFHLTDFSNTMLKYKDTSKSIIESWGQLPHLARRGVATIGLRPGTGGSFQVYALDMDGRRLGEVKTGTAPDGELTFVADTFLFEQPCFVYEIIRSPSKPQAQ